MKFELLERFIEQKAQQEREHGEMVRREQSALESWQAAKAEYEKVLRDSLAKRTDSTKDLDAIAAKIEAAETAFKRRQQERMLFSSVVKPEITAQDIVSEWNGKFQPAFMAERMGPVRQRLLDTKTAYFDACMEYFAAVKEYDVERIGMRGELADTHYYQLGGVDLTTDREFEKYFVVEAHLRSLENGNRP